MSIKLIFVRMASHLYARFEIEAQRNSEIAISCTLVNWMVSEGYLSCSLPKSCNAKVFSSGMRQIFFSCCCSYSGQGLDMALNFIFPPNYAEIAGLLSTNDI